MRILGFDISRATKAAPPVPVTPSRGGWFPLIRESFTGAWQHDIVLDNNTLLTSTHVFACMTLIATDISKLRMKLVELKETGVWKEVMNNAAFGPVIRKPNRYQNRIQFWEQYFLSKMSRGNVYVLKSRDASGVVRELFILDPDRVKPLVDPDANVYYQLSADNMSRVREDVMVPASEIIHDRYNCLYHPLMGMSPISAAAIAATQSNNIQSQSNLFFKNSSTPGGLLTAPGEISAETALELKTTWETKYSGSSAGKIAVLGDDLKYTSLSMKATDAQLIEQLKMTAEMICSVFHVPPYKVSVGQMPSYNNVEALNVEYYSQALQGLMEAAELCMDEGLGLGVGSPKTDNKILGTEFDIDNLLRMDSAAQMSVIEKAAGVLTIDEMRKRIDAEPTPGGDAVYLQQQNYSLPALAKRDAGDDPFGTAAKAPAPVAEPAPSPNKDEYAEYELLLGITYKMKKLVGEAQLLSWQGTQKQANDNGQPLQVGWDGNSKGLSA